MLKGYLGQLNKKYLEGVWGGVFLGLGKLFACIGIVTTFHTLKRWKCGHLPVSFCRGFGREEETHTVRAAALCTADDWAQATLWGSCIEESRGAAMVMGWLWVPCGGRGVQEWAGAQQQAVRRKQGELASVVPATNTPKRACIGTGSMPRESRTF